MKTTPSTPDRERWTPDQDAELTKLRGAGQTYPEISLAMKRSKRSVRARMTLLGKRADYAASGRSPSAISPFRPLDKGREERGHKPGSAGVPPAGRLEAGAPSAPCDDGLAVPEKRARVRPCLCCGKDFFSQGPHNRLCGICRSKRVGPYDI